MNADGTFQLTFVIHEPSYKKKFLLVNSGAQKTFNIFAGTSVVSDGPLFKQLVLAPNEVRIVELPDSIARVTIRAAGGWGVDDIAWETDGTAP